jgi:hypothetical protein
MAATVQEPLRSSSVITSNVFQRVVLLTCGQSLGTGFAIEVDDRQYLVTARHVAARDGASGPPFLAENGVMRQVRVLGESSPADPSIDVTVFALAEQIAPALECLPSTQGLTWGQDTYFLGFPFAMQGVPSVEGRPLPLVKHAQHSGEVVDEHGQRVIVLDGLNVHGFSGGPLVFRPQPGAPFQIAGVIQSFMRHESSIIDATGADTEYKVVTNPGILFAYNIKHAVDAARTLGDGVVVQAS